MISGFLCLNKEGGMTSGRVLSKLKSILRKNGVDFQKLGHMGTLDPDGEGVLPVALGRATRLFPYLSEKEKIYETVFRFGETTDTLDASGQITASGGRFPFKEEILAIIPNLTGEIDQIPPMYSAKSVNGMRAYDLARKGIEVNLRPRTVQIKKIELAEQLSQAEFRFIITCGGGTYIRSIARDMAAALHTYGLMSYIKRLKSGIFKIKDAATLRQLEKNPLEYLISIDKVLSDYPCFEIPNTLQGIRFWNGIPMDTDCEKGKIYRLTQNDGTVGLANVNKEGKLEWQTRLI